MALLRQCRHTGDLGQDWLFRLLQHRALCLTTEKLAVACLFTIVIITISIFSRSHLVDLPHSDGCAGGVLRDGAPRLALRDAQLELYALQLRLQAAVTQVLHRFDS